MLAHVYCVLSVFCIVHRVTEEVVAIRHKVIHFPKTAEDLVAWLGNLWVCRVGKTQSFFKSC